MKSHLLYQTWHRFLNQLLFNNQLRGRPKLKQAHLHQVHVILPQQPVQDLLHIHMRKVPLLAEAKQVRTLDTLIKHTRPLR